VTARKSFTLADLADPDVTFPPATHLSEIDQLIHKEPAMTETHDAELMIPDRIAAPARQQDVPLSVMIDTALKSGVGVDVINGLYELYRKQQADVGTAALNAALARFRKICPRITRNREGYHKRKDGTPIMYADLSHTLDIAGPALTECELSVSWDPIQVEGSIKHRCFLRHSSGAFISADSLAFPVAKGADAGEVLKVDGYARRNAFVNVSGLTSVDEEDDSASPDPINAEQIQIIEEHLFATTDPDGWRPRLLKWAGVDSVDKIPATKFDEAVRRAVAKKGVRA
jgi:hypothetical protein